VLLASIGTRLLLASVATGVSDLAIENPLDGRVLLFSALVSLITGLAFGIAPAFRATRLDLNRALASSGRSLIAGSGRGGPDGFWLSRKSRCPCRW